MGSSFVLSLVQVSALDTLTEHVRDVAGTVDWPPSRRAPQPRCPFEPAVSPLIAVIVLGEHLPPIGWLGQGLLFASLVITATNTRPQPPVTLATNRPARRTVPCPLTGNAESRPHEAPAPLRRNHDGPQRSGRGDSLAERFNPSRQNALRCRDGPLFWSVDRSCCGHGKGPRQPTVECADDGANVLGDTPPDSAAISLPGDQSWPAVDAGTDSFPSQKAGEPSMPLPSDRAGRPKCHRRGDSCK